MEVLISSALIGVLIAFVTATLRFYQNRTVTLESDETAGRTVASLSDLYGARLTYQQVSFSTTDTQTFDSSGKPVYELDAQLAKPNMAFSRDQFHQNAADCPECPGQAGVYGMRSLFVPELVEVTIRTKIDGKERDLTILTRQ